MIGRLTLGNWDSSSCVSGAHSQSFYSLSLAFRFVMLQLISTQEQKSVDGRFLSRFVILQLTQQKRGVFNPLTAAVYEFWLLVLATVHAMEYTLRKMEGTEAYGALSNSIAICYIAMYSLFDPCFVFSYEGLPRKEAR